MLYAEVIVKQRTNVEELTYAVPAQIVPYIRSGSLVSVPLRRKEVPGVVVSLRRTVSKELRSHIRPISSIQRGAGFSAGQIEVIKRLGAYYGASLAEVAFHALKTPGGNRSEPSGRRSKPVIIQAPWSERKKRYLALIRRYHPAQSLLFIFAQNSYAQSFGRLASSRGEKVIFNNSSAATRKKVAAWQSQGEKFVLISTIQDLFSPLDGGDVMIVDQPYHMGAKQQHRPFMTARTVARVRSEVESLRLVYGVTLAAVEDIPLIQRGETRMVSYLRSPMPIAVFNRQRSRLLVMPSVFEEISRRVTKGEKMLVLVLSRGWAPALVCVECGHIFACSNCGRTSSVEAGRLACRYCHHQSPLPHNCSSCGAENLKAVGEGVSQVAKKLSDSVSNASIQEFSSDQPNFQTQSQVTVATEKIFTLPDVRFDAVFLLSVDRLLSSAEFNNNWELLEYLLGLQDRSGQVMVQTYFPDHPLWGVVGALKLKEFFQQELSSRKRYGLPPYQHLFRVVGQVRQEKALKDQADKLTQEIARFFDRAEIGYLEIEKQRNGEYRGQFSVLVPSFPIRVRSQLRDLLPPAWYLDIEPIS